MRIAVVNSFYPPWRGGAETYVSNLARCLVKLGHEVTVLCSEKPLKAGIYLDEGVKVWRMEAPLRVYGTPVFPELTYRLLSEEFDLVHANFPSPYVAACSSLASLLRAKPAVLTWHNDLPPVAPLARGLISVHDRIAMLYLRLFRAIIATTRAYALKSRILRSLSSRVHVIPCGVDASRFSPSVSGRRVREELGAFGRVVLFVGALTRWHGYKGLDVLLKAMRLVRQAVKDVKLIVVGDGELRVWYEKLAEKAGVRDVTCFAGDVSDERLPEYYAAADLLAMPSKDDSEGFGIVALEANACGKPVVACKVGGVVDVVRSGVNGVLVEPNSPGQLASAIVRLLTRDDLREELGRRGRRLAERYDWMQIAARVSELYAAVAGG